MSVSLTNRVNRQLAGSEVAKTLEDCKGGNDAREAEQIDLPDLSAIG
jgi:hypothetical protein